MQAFPAAAQWVTIKAELDVSPAATNHGSEEAHWLLQALKVILKCELCWKKGHVPNKSIFRSGEILRLCLWSIKSVVSKAGCIHIKVCIKQSNEVWTNVGLCY